MRNTFSFFGLAFVLLLCSAYAQENDPKEGSMPYLVHHLPEKVFSLSGFDNNDNVQIVADAAFTSTCYKTGPTQVKVDEAKKTIFVDNQAYYYPCFCLQVMVPYHKVIDLGILKTGTYKVVFLNAKSKKTAFDTLTIRHSSSVGPDDYLYAPIQEANLERTGADLNLVLKGQFSNSCMAIKEIKIIKERVDMLVVLPIMEIKEGGNCQTGAFDFNVKTPIENLTKETSTLIHVRSLNGKSQNIIVPNRANSN